MRQNDMLQKVKRVLEVLLIIAYAAAFLSILTARGSDNEETESDLRFYVEYEEQIDGCKVRIIHDNETGRDYMYYSRGYGGGLTLMPEEPEETSLGLFTVTAYCPCEECTGKTPDHPAYKITSSGTTATQGRTVAADPLVIAPGSRIALRGPDGLQEYVVEDTGVTGNAIDLYFEDHEDAKVWGVKELEVFLR